MNTLRALLVALTIVGPLVAFAEPGAPTWRDAANATYSLAAGEPAIVDEPFRLQNGVYEGEPYAPGGSSRPRVVLVPDFVRTGDLDGDGQDDTMVLLSASAGGSGTFDYLALLTRRGSSVETIGVAPLGDRVQLMSATIGDGDVALRVVQAGADDPACCPGEVTDRTLSWRDGALVETGSASSHRLSGADLADRTWTLLSIDREAIAILETPVTLVIDSETVSGNSGCNDYRGTMTDEAGPGAIRFSVLATTRMACPELQTGLEQRYLAALAQTSGFRFLATRLLLVGENPAGGALLFEASP